MNFKNLWRLLEEENIFYKSEFLHENEVAESSPKDMSVMKGPQTANEVAIAGSAKNVPRTMLDLRLLRSVICNSGFIHGFGEFPDTFF